MPLMISDETLQEAGLSAQNALIEFACRLFDAGRLSLPKATRLAGLSRDQFLAALADRHIPAYRPTVDDVLHDVTVVDSSRGAM
jgi:predicted HTH domain antitoxin